MSELQAAANTDRELFRDGIDDYYADKIFVTKDGAIGINCVGTVYVKTMRDWHNLAQRVDKLEKLLAREESSHERTLERLEAVEATADELATVVSEITGDEIGEYTAGLGIASNDPLQNAITDGKAYIAQRAADRLARSAYNGALIAAQGDSL